MVATEGPQMTLAQQPVVQATIGVLAIHPLPPVRRLATTLQDLGCREG